MIRKFIVVLGNIGVLVLFIVGIQIMGSMVPKPEQKVSEPKLPAVYIQTAEYAPVELIVTTQGEVRPKREIILSPQVSGQVVRVSDKFVDGGVITKGDLLVKIEAADYQSALIRARARVASSLQALQIERAESALAQRDFDELNGLGGAAASDLTLRRPQLARAQAEYNASKADLSDAELSVKRTEIRAPFDGRVRSISANIGQFVTPGTKIGELFATDIAQVRLPLSDSDLAKLRLPFAFTAEYGKGPAVKYSTIAAGQKRTWYGSLVGIAAAIDPSTRQISAISRLEDPYGAGSDDGFPMAIGLFVTAEIAGPVLEKAILLPRVAVQNDNTVYTLDADNVVLRRTVTIAASTARGVVITDGIADGERVIISRLPTSVGLKVRPLDPNAPIVAPKTKSDTEAEDGADDDSQQSAQASPATTQGAE